MGQNQNPPKQPRNVQTGSNLRVAMHLTLPFLVTCLAVVVLGAAYSPKADSPGSLAGRADFLDSGGDLCSQESGPKCCDPYTCTRIMSSLSDSSPGLRHSVPVSRFDLVSRDFDREVHIAS